MNLRKDTKGFTLMELVVTMSIMGTLAAFAIPHFMEVGNKAKGTKSLDNINNIGQAILQTYTDLAGNGVSPNAIATFSASPNDSFKVGIDIIQYDSLGTTATIDVEDLFPNGAPKSPFNDRYYVISAVTAGSGTWTTGGGIVKFTLTQQPSITIQDPTYTNLQNTFTP